jgi:hypothetical protein
MKSAEAIRMSHSLVCRKRRLIPLYETRKTEMPCHSRCGTIKNAPCSKALSAEHRPKFWNPSPVTVTSPHMWNIFEPDVKQWIINQSINICTKADFCLPIFLWNCVQSFRVFRVTPTIASGPVYSVTVHAKREIKWNWCYSNFYQYMFYILIWFAYKNF